MCSVLSVLPGCALLTRIPGALSSAAAPRVIQPISISSHSVLCEMGREVYADLQNLSPTEVAYAKAAVDEINSVVPGIYRWRGVVSHEKAIAQVHAGFTVFLASAERPTKEQRNGALAVTMLKAQGVCLIGTPIVILVREGELSPMQHKTAFLHELVHALGFLHAAENGKLASVMYPTVDQCTDHLTMGDKAAIRAVYGRAL